MKFLKLAFWALVAVCLIVVAMANHQMVELRAMPDWLAGFLGLTPVVSLPLYLVIFAGFAAGLVVGLVWEWLREHKHRTALSRGNKEVQKLSQEVKRLKTDKHEGADEVLAILENASVKS